MELFLLGVGNYTEADVEASTAAWTGHSDQWDDDVSPYRWRPEWHDSRPKDYLGQRINTDPNPATWPSHGPETIDVVLGSGVVPDGAGNVANRGRSTRDVAAEFLSRKLWNDFATEGAPPADVLTAMRVALVSNDFAIQPWVTAMLTHPAFYTDAVKSGLRAAPRSTTPSRCCTRRETFGVRQRHLVDGGDGAASAVSAECQRLAIERLLGQRERDGGSGENRAELRLGDDADLLAERRRRV